MQTGINIGNSLSDLGCAPSRIADVEIAASEQADAHRLEVFRPDEIYLLAAIDLLHLLDATKVPAGCGARLRE
jgi:hypothetical protein